MHQVHDDDVIPRLRVDDSQSGRDAESIKRVVSRSCGPCIAAELATKRSRSAKTPTCAFFATLRDRNRPGTAVRFENTAKLQANG